MGLDLGSVASAMGAGERVGVAGAVRVVELGGVEGSVGVVERGGAAGGDVRSRVMLVVTL